VNPFIRLYEAPVATLTDAAFGCLLVAALIGTWWALGRNLLYLDNNYQNGWKYLVPFWYAVRLIAVISIVAVDLALIAALIAVLSP